MALAAHHGHGQCSMKQSTAVHFCPTTPRPLQQPCEHSHRCLTVQAASNASNGNDIGRNSKPSVVPTNAVSTAQLLQRVEFSAIAVAAVCQAAILVSTALCQWRQTKQLAELQEQLHNLGIDGTDLEPAVTSTAHAEQHVKRQQQQMQMQQQIIDPFQQPAAPSSGLYLISSSALVVGLLCGAGLRQLQVGHSQHSAGAVKPSAGAAARLAALEVAAQQVSTQLTTTARQMDKLQARVRLATSDLKQPIKAVQGAAAQQAAALLKLTEQQALLQQQVDGSQELIAALQGLAAKQFKVSAEALQQLKQGQVQLRGNTNEALVKLTQQQQAVQTNLQAQQKQLRGLEQSVAALRRWQQQQDWEQPAPDRGTNNNHSSSWAAGVPPDPWQAQPAADSGVVASSSRSSGGDGSTDSRDADRDQAGYTPNSHISNGQHSYC